MTVFQADAQRFDLLLTDLTMPGMTGVALARAVTRLRPGMPVLLCTAFSDDFRDDEINDAGVKDVLSKSLGSKNPANVVKATLDGLAKLRTRGDVEGLRKVSLAHLRFQGAAAGAKAEAAGATTEAYVDPRQG